MMSHLGIGMSFEDWKRENDAKVAALDEAIAGMKALRDSYALQAYPGYLKKSAELSPAGLRRRANAPWDDKSGY